MTTLAVLPEPTLGRGPDNGHRIAAGTYPATDPMSSLLDLIKAKIGSLLRRPQPENDACPVCGERCEHLATVDFNKSCEELRGIYLQPAGIPVRYARCPACGFCFAPDIARWELDRFSQLIYNEAYVQVDPGYLDTRPRANAEGLKHMFAGQYESIRHLDYGGGNGLLSRLLREGGWDSTSCDPFVDKETAIGDIGTFDLVTAYEVFEHVPDPRRLMDDLGRLLKPDGMVLFSTQLSDGQLDPQGPLTWWYASPRNGHISLFSRQSLALLARDQGLQIGSLSDGFHCLWRTIPAWATHLFPGHR